MSTLKRSVIIERPVEDVFAVVTEVTNTGKWFPADVREYWITPPPHGVGSVRRAEITVMGRRSQNDATVIEFDPPRRGVLALDTQGFRGTAMIECAPADGGTRLDATFEVDASGPMRFFLGPFMTWYGNAWTTGLASLKRMMEAGEL